LDKSQHKTGKRPFSRRAVHLPLGGIGSVSVIDTSTHLIVNTITVGKFPNTIAIRPDGAFAYVTDSFSSPPDVSVIDLTTNTVVANPR
jgi:YVTN family beta-propeller protein